MSADRKPQHLRHVLLCFSRHPRHACMRAHLSHSSTIQQHMVHRQKTSSRLPHQQTHTIRPAPSWRSKPRDLLARPLAQQSQPPSISHIAESAICERPASKAIPMVLCCEPYMHRRPNQVSPLDMSRGPGQICLGCRMHACADAQPHAQVPCKSTSPVAVE